MLKTVRYDFPLQTSVNGAMLGNGATGVMIWGKDNILNISVGSADLWDHRGGMELTERQNFTNIRNAAEKGDMPEIKRLFAAGTSAGVRQPSLIPVGRAVITLPVSCELKYYVLELATGCVTVAYSQEGEEKLLEFYADMAMHDVLSGNGLPSGADVKIVSSYELSSKLNYSYSVLQSCNLKLHGFDEPEEFVVENVSGFIQKMPADPSYALMCRRFENGTFTLKFTRGTDTVELICAEKTGSFDEVSASSQKFFSEYWKDIPQISGLDPVLERLYYHGLFKYGIMTNPAGVTPGLQGPWIEDDHLPPWSADYHFNINVQMCNMPGLKAGKFANLKKMFDLVLSWKDKLRRNALNFAGIDNGYMLPHAVDDRCVCMGQFWTGCIDHGCAAWIAKMMFDYCEYTGDYEYLKNEVYDFMSGVLKVFMKLTEEDAEGNLYLPVSVSPEYRAAEINAWGRNASFQLAALHQLAGNMIKAAGILNIPEDADAVKVTEKLPLFSELDGEIALWDGLLPERSHRHHSHLAGICPFDVIDPVGTKYGETVAKSFERFIRFGMGEWAGWSMPWASQLHSRCGNAGASSLCLKIWNDCFCNEGGGSLHNAKYNGMTIIAPREVEIMQMDGAMGVVAAIQEQFLYVYENELRVFWGVVPQKHDISFHGMYAPGGLRVSGRVDKKSCVTCEVCAVRETEVKISVFKSEPYICKLAAGETVKLQLTGNKLIKL